MCRDAKDAKSQTTKEGRKKDDNVDVDLNFI